MPELVVIAFLRTALTRDDLPTFGMPITMNTDPTERKRGCMSRRRCRTNCVGQGLARSAPPAPLRLPMPPLTDPLRL